MAPNLQKRGDVYYARIAIPKSLRDLRESANIEPNPPEVWKSLRTPDRSVAERLLLTVKAEILRAFDLEEERLRREGIRPLSIPTIEDLASMKEEFFLDVLGRDEQSRLARKSVAEIDQMRKDLLASLQKSPPENELALLAAPGVVELMSARDAAEDAAVNRNILREELQKHLAQQNFVLISDTLEAMARERGLVIEPNSLNYKLLGRQLLGAWQAALKVADRREEGIADEVAAPLPMAPPAPSLPTGVSSGSVAELKPKQGKPARGESLKDYFGAYLKEQKAELPRPSQVELWAVLRLFVECNGDHPVTSYAKAHMASFKKGLQAYPKNAAKLYPGVKFKQVIERNKDDQHPVVSSATVRNKLTTISAFGKWLESNADGVDASNFSTTLPRRDDRKRMEPFSLDEVKQILNSSAFVGCESDKNYQKVGSFKLRDWHFWLVLVAAFTGARVNEIVQMDLADLRQEGGIWVFDITNDGEGKSLKTGSSKRLVPVHPRLIELGLLRYQEELGARGAKSLFEDAPIGANGRRSEAASRWFRRFLEKIGVKGEGDLGGAHRWRHTLADELRRSDVDEHDIAIITGHQVNIARMTAQYGREMNMSLVRRLEIISKVTYSGVDFDLLAAET